MTEELNRNEKEMEDSGEGDKGREYVEGEEGKITG